jgi:hypothetical protein
MKTRVWDSRTYRIAWMQHFHGAGTNRSEKISHPLRVYVIY